jgi:hypothetical protein
MQSWMGLNPYHAWFTHLALANKFLKIHHGTQLWVVISNNTKLNLVTRMGQKNFNQQKSSNISYQVHWVGWITFV